MSQLGSLKTKLSICIVISMLVIGGGVAATPVASQSIPPLPGNYYPTVSLADGEITQPVLVEAVADGEVQASIITNSTGGHDGKNLEVQEPDDGEVSFRVGGSESAVRTVDWSQGPQEVSIEATSEDIQTNLAVEITSQTSPVEAGTEATVTAEITNTEGVQATQQIELRNGQEGILDTEEVTVPINESRETTLTFETNESTVGDTTVTVSSANESTETTITVEAPESEEDENTEGGSSGGGGGGGGGDGAGAGGGGSSTDTGPTTIQDVRDTAGLVEPTTNSETPLADANADTPGITVEPAAADSVQRIVFNNETLTGTVPITEYASPPQTLIEDIRESANNDIEGLENDTLNIVFVTDISPTVNATEDSSATVEFVLNRSAVNDPSQLTVIKESYSEETQSDRWKQLETSVVETTEQEVIIEAEVDAFSLFTVAEVTETESSGETDESENNSTGDDGSTDDGLPGFGGITALVAIMAAVFMLQQKRD
jgi:PGF-CTERM protein/PGF-pre-PGF domain-containing protein